MYVRRLLTRVFATFLFAAATCIPDVVAQDARTFLYVVDLQGNRIEAVDLSTNLLEPSRAINVTRPRGLALSSVDDRIFIAALDTFHIFDPLSGPLLQLPLSLSAPLTGDFNFNGTVNFEDFLLFVSGFGKQSGETGFNGILDLNSDAVINFEDFLLFVANFGQSVPPVGTSRAGNKLVLSPDERYAFITEELADQVKIIDLLLASAVASVPTGIGPSGITRSEASSDVYAADKGKSISVIDGEHLRLKSRLGLGGFGNGRVAVSPDGNRVYSARSPDFVNPDPTGITTIQLVALDPEDGSVLDSVTVGQTQDPEVSVDDQVIDMRLSENGRTLYASVQRTAAGPEVGGVATLIDQGVLVAVDAETFEVSSEVVMGALVGQLAISPDQSTAYVVAVESFLNDPFLRLFIIDIEDGQKAGSIGGFVVPVDFGFQAQRPAGKRLDLPEITLF